MCACRSWASIRSATSSEFGESGGQIANGLVSRSLSDGDLRVKPVCLTAEGVQRIELAMLEIVAESGCWIGARLAPDEVAALTGLLTKLIPPRP